MGEHPQYRPSRVVAPLLATAAILLLGTSFCVSIILAFGEAKPIPVAIAVGASIGFGALMWLLRDKPSAEKRNWFAWVAQRQKDEQPVYKLAIIRQKMEYGRNQPPTLEELRDKKDPTRTWVPRRGRTTESSGEDAASD